MRCTSCGYPLWQLPGRTCPECGAGFKPSDFTLNPNSVRFCCPHCRQEYYGTDENGHLVPRSFDCIRCAAAIDMDEMILLPVEGLTDSMTRGRLPDPNPWLRRRQLGHSGAGWRTIGRVLVSPGSLMDTPPHAGALVLNAFYFALIIAGVTALIGVGPFALMFSLGPGGSAPILGGVAAVLATIGVLIAYLLIIGVLAHTVMAISGGARRGIGRSIECALYSGGTFILSAVPCVGIYLIPVSLIWGGVSLGLMLRRAHDVSGARSVIAGVTGPVLIALALVGTVIGLMTWSFSKINSARTTALPAMASMQTGSALNLAQIAEGAWPAHGLDLVRAGLVDADMIADATGSPPTELLPGIDAFEYSMLSPRQLDTLAQDVLDAMPDGVIAHRLGDIVFTFHGLPPDGTARPEAWTAVWAPHPSAVRPARPASNSGPESVAIVSTADGQQQRFATGADFNAALTAENDARAAEGLPPLPDLLNFDWVATESAPGSQPLPDFTP